jgi:predicted RNase H-like HicB family nuclease
MELHSSEEARRIAKVSYRQLDSWTRIGLVKPEREATGSGTARRWSPAQVIELRVIGDLRRAGLSMPRVRRAVGWLRRAWPKLAAPLAEFSFVTDGQRVFYLSPNPGKLIDLLADGQVVLAVPMGEIAEKVGATRGVGKRESRVQYDLPERVEPGESGYFIGYCPALRGCVAQGRTRAEAHTNLRKAIASYLAVLEEMAAEEPHARKVAHKLAGAKA